MPLRTPLLVALLLAPAAVARQPPAAVESPDDPDRAVVRTLAVQQALSQGRALLRDGRAREAVEVLEKELPRIDGNPLYLAALRDAYAALIKELQLQRQADRVAVYQRKLQILDPAAGAGSSDGPLPAAEPPAALAPPQPMPAPPAPEPVSPSALPPAPEPVAAPEAPPPDRKARGKGEEGDPFRQVPADQGRAAAELLTRAGAAFERRDYSAAHVLYRQATAADPTAAACHAEQIAYCQLAQVVEHLNRPAPGSPPLAELERDATEALKRSPRLETIGRTVLAEIQKRKATGPAAPAGASEPPVDGWTVVESANFRVCHQGAPELADQVSKLAEQTRQAMFARWFGNANGGAWSPRCTVYLHPDAAAYARATGKPATSSGHATIQARGVQVVGRRLDLRGDDLNLLPATLPHETTHVVLADLFGDQVLPRWADEGMAVMAESPAHQERYRRAVQRFAREGRLISLEQLMQRPDLPTDPAAATAYFVQSVALVEFLAAQKGQQAFAVFLREAPRRGFGPCLQRHYGYRDVAELQAQWQQHVLREASGPAAGEGAQ
jgi:hypothetical protein